MARDGEKPENEDPISSQRRCSGRQLKNSGKRGEREKRENAISDQLREQNGQTLEQMVPSDEQAKRKLRITSI